MSDTSLALAPAALPHKKPSENGTANSTPLTNNVTLTSKSTTNGGSRRIEVEVLVNELQRKLGTNWDRYQRTISLFLLGKLSRLEFTANLAPMLTDSQMVRMHNQLLLANLANSLREGPNQQLSKRGGSGFGSGASGKRRKDSKVKVSSQYEKLKKNIMNLPIRERYRLKTLSRDSGKRNMASSSLTLTRQAMLPKVPVVMNEKDRNFTGNTVEWAQDISHSLQVPLATESFNMPDNDTLEGRMLGIAREHGLTGTIDKSVYDLLSIGLEAYMKSILEGAIDTVRYRKRKYLEDDLLTSSTDYLTETKRPKITLTTEDILDTLRISPYLIEPSGPLIRLHSVMLNDDTYIEEKTAIDSYLKHPRPDVSPVHSPIAGQKVKGNTAESKKDGDVKIEEADNLENIGTKEELDWLIYDILKSR